MRSKITFGIAASIALMTTIVVTTPILLQLQVANAYIINSMEMIPIAASGKNMYVTWWTDQKKEVMFRASTDGGKTFSDKINLSNTPHSNSAHATIAASGNNVYVSFHDNKTGNVDT
jgi:hypothetical protein